MHWQLTGVEETRTAQAILDARALYPDSSLADLYDLVTMPPELLAAHRANNRAVMAAYGFLTTMSESDILAVLFTLYSRTRQTTDLSEKSDFWNGIKDEAV